MIRKRQSRPPKPVKIHHVLAGRRAALPRFMFCSAVAVSGALIMFCGCGEKEAAQPTAPPPTSVSEPAQQVAAVPVAQTPAPLPPVATAPQGGADLKDLNHAYIRWVVQSHRHAKTFEEFVAASGISVPPPPASKKYIIDKAGFINLADR